MNGDNPDSLDTKAKSTLDILQLTGELYGGKIVK
jgi:hypothetical protein